MHSAWNRHLVPPFVVFLGFMLLAASGGFSDPGAKGMKYPEVTFYVA